MNIDAHWFRNRHDRWSVRIEWTALDGSQQQRHVHTGWKRLFKARRDVDFEQVIRDPRLNPRHQKVDGEWVSLDDGGE